MGLGLSIRVTNVWSRGMECGMKVISVDGETVTVLCEMLDTETVAGVYQLFGFVVLWGCGGHVWAYI